MVGGVGVDRCGRCGRRGQVWFVCLWSGLIEYVGAADKGTPDPLLSTLPNLCPAVENQTGGLILIFHSSRVGDTPPYRLYYRVV